MIVAITMSMSMSMSMSMFMSMIIANGTAVDDFHNFDWVCIVVASPSIARLQASMSAIALNLDHFDYLMFNASVSVSMSMSM